MRLILSLFLLGLLVSAALTSGSRNRLLVLVDDLEIESSHSVFLEILGNQGYSVDVRHVEEDNIPFNIFGEYVYDALVLLAPTASDFPELMSSDEILEYIDAGHDVMVIGDHQYSYATEEVGAGCGVSFHDADSFVIDHFNFEMSDNDGYHDLIVADDFAHARVVGGEYAPVLYRGVGMSLNPKNSLVFSFLSAHSTSYSATQTQVLQAGSKTSLVAGLQARNNARVTISGSVEMFSDEFLLSSITRNGNSVEEKSGNLDFVKDLVAWNFHNKGVLRIKEVNHYETQSGERSTLYTIKDNLRFALTVEEWNGSKWVPFSANDIQLELQMLDPYIRTTLTDEGNGVHAATFVAPDTYGVYTFKVNYHRMGYSYLDYEELVTIRPFRHTQYERFIPCAFPYYTAAFSMMAGVSLFAAIFMFHK